MGPGLDGVGQATLSFADPSNRDQILQWHQEGVSFTDMIDRLGIGGFDPALRAVIDNLSPEDVAVIREAMVAELERVGPGGAAELPVSCTIQATPRPWTSPPSGSTGGPSPASRRGPPSATPPGHGPGDRRPRGKPAAVSRQGRREPPRFRDPGPAHPERPGVRGDKREATAPSAIAGPPLQSLNSHPERPGVRGDKREATAPSAIAGPPLQSLSFTS